MKFLWTQHLCLFTALSWVLKRGLCTDSHSSRLFLRGRRGCFPKIDQFNSLPAHSPGTARQHRDLRWDTDPEQRRRTSLWQTGMPSHSHLNQTGFNTTCIQSSPTWVGKYLTSFPVETWSLLVLWGFLAPAVIVENQGVKKKCWPAERSQNNVNTARQLN